MEISWEVTFMPSDFFSNDFDIKIVSRLCRTFDAGCFIHILSL